MYRNHKESNHLNRWIQSLSQMSLVHTVHTYSQPSVPGPSDTCLVHTANNLQAVASPNLSGMSLVRIESSFVRCLSANRSETFQDGTGCNLSHMPCLSLFETSLLSMLYTLSRAPDPVQSGTCPARTKSSCWT